MENVSKLICEIASGRPRRKSRRLRPHHRGRDLDMRYRAGVAGDGW